MTDYRSRGTQPRRYGGCPPEPAPHPTHGPAGAGDKWFQRWERQFTNMNETVPVLLADIEKAMRRDLGISQR